MGDKTSSEKPPYHHGDLRQALLLAAEQILIEEGLQALTLRATARAVGVSHAAPKNHFGSLTGLLSDLAAVGFNRFRDQMLESSARADDAASRLNAIGKSYVEFAESNPSMFLLMFRSDFLDYDRPSLQQASAQAFGVLANIASAQTANAETASAQAANTQSERQSEAMLPVEQAAHIVSSWALVHGFATLLLDGRLNRILAQTSPKVEALELLDSILNGRSKK